MLVARSVALLPHNKKVEFACSFKRYGVFIPGAPVSSHFQKKSNGKEIKMQNFPWRWEMMDLLFINK